MRLVQCLECLRFGGEHENWCSVGRRWTYSRGFWIAAIGIFIGWMLAYFLSL